MKYYYDLKCLEMINLIEDARIREIYDTLISKYRYSLLIPLNFCDSPIEKMLYLCLMDEQLRFSAQIGGNLKVMPQMTITLEGRSYKPDFTLILEKPNGETLKAIIECDGHEFHEKTKEQARHDRQRERLFVKHGYTVLRYTGREVYEDAFKCAEEIFNTLKKLFEGKKAEAAGD